jgi:hypothetical protein
VTKSRMGRLTFIFEMPLVSGGDLSGFQNGQDHPVAKDDLATG